VYDFAAVEEMAEFPGGKGAFQRYLGRHLAGTGGLEEGVTKTVKVKFVIGKDGSILDIVLLQSGGNGLDETVVKVLRKAPRWKPARQNGQAVAVVYTLPVTFVGGGD
jgi:protein TonB